VTAASVAGRGAGRGWPDAPGQGRCARRVALAEVVSAAGISYGYTLTIWSSGALCIGRFGLPSPEEAFLFVGGATIAYVLLASVAALLAGARGPRAARDSRIVWENTVAAPALAATYGVSRVVGAAWASFLLVPLVGTLLYLLGLSVLVSFVSRRIVSGRDGAETGPMMQPVRRTDPGATGCQPDP
jgi:hypothetical protein